METSDRVIVAYVSTSCSRPGRSSSGTRAQHTSSALPISSAATRAMISSLSCVSVSILTCLAVIGTEGGHCPREPQGHMEESDPRAQGDTEEPIAGSRHPAENRPRRSWRNRRQQAAATPDFPPRTGVTAGIPGAEKRKSEFSKRADRVSLAGPVAGKPASHPLIATGPGRAALESAAHASPRS